MTTKKITFDPESGVAYSCDLIMNVGADFNAKFNIVDTANTGFNFSTTNSVGLNTMSGHYGERNECVNKLASAFPEMPLIYNNMKITRVEHNEV